MYRKLSDKEFLRRIFTAEDRLRMDYIEEVKVRRLAAVPFMFNALINENNYRFSDERFGGAVTREGGFPRGTESDRMRAFERARSTGFGFPGALF